jgi:release factor glutamine methyltransferase
LRLAETLHAAQRSLSEAGIDDARLEAEVLLGHALRLQRHQLYARLQDDIDDAQLVEFKSLLERRLAREPTAYIVGHKEFYGLDLETTPAAPIPRPETELLVEEALKAGAETLVDVGTGCGAIALALAHHLPNAVIYATDRSPQALALAARNAEKLSLADRIRFLEGDLLDPLPEPVDLIAANLPYVKSDDWDTLAPEIRKHEPRSALEGGPAGIDVIERLLRQAMPTGRQALPYLRPRGRLLAEIGWDQGERLREIARQCFPEAQIQVKKDTAGLDRLLLVL